MPRRRQVVPQETLPAAIVPWATVTGLAIPAEITFDEWVASGLYLKVSYFAHKWWLVDWLLKGEDFGDQGRQAVAEMWGMNEHSLISILSAGSRFPPERRRPELSFEHHREVAYMPEELADDLLDKAIAENWTCKFLRGRAREKKLEHGIPLGPNPHGPVSDQVARIAPRIGRDVEPSETAHDELLRTAQTAVDCTAEFFDAAQDIEREGYDKLYLKANAAKSALLDLMERLEKAGVEPL